MCINDQAYAAQFCEYLIYLRKLKLGVLACKHSGVLPLYKVTQAVQIGAQACTHIHTQSERPTKQALPTCGHAWVHVGLSGLVACRLYGCFPAK